jgi:O-antigen/teichoic acid export membrane protein
MGSNALRSQQAAFLVTNVAANFIFIARSYVTMRELDYRELGIVTVMQAIMLLVGTLQFGVLNGGYRLLCSADDEDGKAINNVAYACFGIITLASLLIALLSDQFLAPGVAAWVTVAGVAGGALTLVRSWINNQMIAKQQLALLNQVTMWSAVLSLLPLLALDVHPLAMCILSIVIQPALFTLFVLVAGPQYRPQSLSLDKAILQRIFVAGFFIFLSGMSVQVNAQLERWYVARYLGLDALGHLYLALLVVNLFSIVPNALQSVQMPRIVQAWDQQNSAGVQRGMRQLLLLNLGYCLIAGIALAFLAEPLVRLFLPKYVPDLHYVYLIVPGLALYTICSAVAVIFNVLIRYRTYNIGFGVGTLITVAAFSLTPIWGVVLSLEDVTLTKSVAYGLTGLIFLWGFWIVSREHRPFRFGLLPGGLRR